MGSSAKWVKSIMGFNKSHKEDSITEKGNAGTSKKWKLWRSSSGEIASSSKGFKGGRSMAASPTTSDTFTAAMATVVRAPPKDFMIVMKEWAAIRIQTALRGFLARRALKVLQGIARLQALYRGRQVRNQTASDYPASSSPRSDPLTAAMAVLVRAPPKDFRIIVKEWASIRIQTAFRGFLARRATKVLKAIVRLQALARGKQVRKQAAGTLWCMEAFVRNWDKQQGRQHENPIYD